MDDTEKEKEREREASVAAFQLLPVTDVKSTLLRQRKKKECVTDSLESSGV